MKNVTIRMTRPVITALTALILGSAAASATIVALPGTSAHVVVVHSAPTSSRMTLADGPNDNPWT
jgi:hypothetical protein